MIWIAAVVGYLAGVGTVGWVWALCVRVRAQRTVLNDSLETTSARDARAFTHL